MQKEFEYWMLYLDRCWAAREKCRSDQVKLMYWFAGLLFINISIAGYKIEFITPKTLPYFSVIVNLIFLAIWGYLLNKQFKLEFFEKKGSLIENYLKQKYISNKQADKQMQFQQIKGTYLMSKKYRALYAYPNALFYILFLATSIFPYIVIIPKQENALDRFLCFLPIISIILLQFALGVFMYYYLFKKEKERTLKKVETDWENGIRQAE